MDSRNNQWQDAQRQSPAAIFILLWSTTIKLIKGFWPLLVVYVFKQEKNDDNLMLLWVGLGFSMLAIGGAVIGYWFKKFQIKEETLIIQTGWLKKKTLSIPAHTIQAVHLEQNVWQQALGVAKVSFDSTGSDDIEAKLDALAIGKAEQLRFLLMQKTSALPEDDDLSREHASSIYSLAFSDLVKLSLTANHLEAFLILFALIFNLLDELKQIFGSNEYIDEYGRQLLGQTTLFISVLVIMVTVLSMLFSMVRTMVTYYGFNLVEGEQRWIIAYGLFDKTKNIIPTNKIQILSWNANWLRRNIDYWTIKIQTIGHKENKKNKVNIPVISFEKVKQLVNSYQYFDGIDEHTSLPIEAAYWKRRAGRNAVLLTLAPVTILYLWIGWQALVFLALFPYLVWNYYRWYKNFRWQTNEAGLQMISGVFGRKYTLLNWQKVQQIHLQQNFYQRRRQLATVIFVTAGGTVTLPYIRQSIAIPLIDQVLYEVESKEISWM